MGGGVPNAWQQWNVNAGLFWYTRTVTCANGVINGVAGGPESYRLAQIVTKCPSARIVGFGVNIGSTNPSYTVEPDLVDFNGTVYEFELHSPRGTGGDPRWTVDCPPPSPDAPPH